MNIELQNLIKAALADGYISDKEMNILKTKAAQLNITEDELELFIESEKYNLMKGNNETVQQPLKESVQPTVENKSRDLDDIIDKTFEKAGEKVSNSINKGAEKVVNSGLFNWGIGRWFEDVDSKKVMLIFQLILIAALIAIGIFVLQWVIAHIWWVVGGSVVVLFFFLWYNFSD